jgi:hypothetical protein
VSGGDPLLVGLYAEHLWEQLQQRGQIAWNKQELQRFSDGLQGFFKRWFEDQKQLWRTANPLREKHIRAILTILSQALGSMKSENIQEIARRVYDFKAWTLWDALEPISRFVVGDGVNQGLALSHPRLNEFFGDVSFMPADERDEIRASFVSWGREVFQRLAAGSLECHMTPVYLLEHLGEHFIGEQVPAEEFRNFLSDGWVESWEFRDPTYRGFVADVQRTWDISEAEDQGTIGRRLGTEAHCMLAIGSIQSQFSLPPARILERSVNLDS